MKTTRIIVIANKDIVFLSALGTEMMENDSDVDLLVDLTKEKDELESQVTEYMD